MANSLVTGNIETAILKWIAPLFPQESAVEKGDLPGHPFHGNQYQDGSGTSIPGGVHTINGENVIIAPNANLVNVNLNRANLTNADLNHANLYNAGLVRADLTDTNLAGAKLTEANLTNANLTGARIGYADLYGAKLMGANLTNANLGDAKLVDANLRDANLTNANLSGAYLKGANLTRANLSGANLANAQLWGANLTGANLSGVNLYHANLTGTRGDENTKLPDTHEVVGGFVVERVTKGDLPGHPFHGNQYSHGEAASASNEAHQGAQSLLRAARNGGRQGGDEELTLKPDDFVDIHMDHASEHADLAQNSSTLAGQQAHAIAESAHSDAADAWNDPSQVFSGAALRATQEAASASERAARIANEDAASAERQSVGAVNERPTDRNGDPIVTKDSPAVQVARGDVTPEEQSKYFNAPGEGKYIGGYGGAVTLPDGMVNPLTGEIGTGSKVSYGYDPSESHMVVQGERPGGSVFTRVIRADGGEKIGDSMSFIHDQTGRNQGYGRVIGIVDPSTGRAFGDFPNKKLSYHGYQ